MRPRVQLALPNGSCVDLFPGDLIGRLHTAALCLSDARISEAHALVSLRGRDLKLLALRGRMAVNGSTSNEIVLHEGVTIHLAQGLAVTVTQVDVPERVLALSLNGGVPQVLPGLASVCVGTACRLLVGWQPDAVARVWSDETCWRVQTDGEVRQLHPGDVVEAGGVRMEASWVASDVQGANATVVKGTIEQPLRLVARFDAVHVHREGQPVVVFSGLMARLISELTVTGVPLSWESLAGELWGTADRTVLRRRWDVLLARTRGKLRENGLRTDLIRADGSGLIELVLRDHDAVADET